MDVTALSLSLRLAALTTVCLLLLATPLSVWLAGRPTTGSRGAFRSTTIRRVVQAAVALPLVLPPTVLGFYLLVGLGPTTALGRTLITLLGHPLAFTFNGLLLASMLYSLPFAVQPLVNGFGAFDPALTDVARTLGATPFTAFRRITLLGHPLAFTFNGLLLASMLYSLPFAVQPLVNGFSAVDPALTDVARTLGATPFTAFRRITLPLARPAFLTSAVLTFAHTLGEFGVVLMVGGDLPGRTRTLSIALFDQVQEGQFSAANRTSLLLLTFSFVALLFTYSKAGRQRRAGNSLV